MHSHISMFLGEPIENWMALQAHYRANNFKDAKEFVEHQANFKEYQATNSLLKARLERIQKLAGLSIQEAA